MTTHHHPPRAFVRHSPLAQNLNRMIQVGSLQFLPMMLGIGAFYGLDCQLRKMITGDADGGVVKLPTASGSGSSADHTPGVLMPGPAIPGRGAAAGGTPNADDAKREAAWSNANTSRSVSGAFCGALMFATRGFRPMLMGLVSGAVLGRFLLPTWDELPGVKDELEKQRRRRSGGGDTSSSGSDSSVVP